jgi:hypothetical protein
MMKVVRGIDAFPQVTATGNGGLFSSGRRKEVVIFGAGMAGPWRGMHQDARIPRAGQPALHLVGRYPPRTWLSLGEGVEQALEDVALIHPQVLRQFEVAAS